MRGGFRNGAGRPAGSVNKVNNGESRVLSSLAKEHTKEALDALISIAKHGRSEGARVNAAIAILDRAYGKPHQSEPTSSQQASSIILRVVEESEECPSDNY